MQLPPTTGCGALAPPNRALAIAELAGPQAALEAMPETTANPGLPEANTVVVTLANGTANSGYIPNDASFGAYTFQVLSSGLQPGCAENAIDNGLLDLIQADQR